MDRSFPSPPQLQVNYCFLSPLEEQQRLLVNLNSSLLFHSLSPLEGREPLGEGTPPAPPPKPGNQLTRRIIPPMNLQLLYQLYQPRWRTRGLALPQPFPDRQHGTYSAAQIGQLYNRSTHTNHEPSPGDIPTVNQQTNKRFTAHPGKKEIRQKPRNDASLQKNLLLQEHAEKPKECGSKKETLAEQKTKFLTHKPIKHYHIYLHYHAQPSLYSLSSTNPYPLSSKSINNLSTNPNTPKENLMADMSNEDEALIARFVGLTTGDGAVSVISIPQHATSSNDWTKCLLLKVVTEKTVMDDSFIGAMSKAWAVGPEMEMEQITRNCYLARFQEGKDRQRIAMGGPWTFRGDMVAMAKVQSHQDLCPEHVTHMDAWVQFFNIPHNSLTEEGLLIMAAEVGAPISGSVHGFVSGRPFVKVKLRMEIEAECKDMVKFKHRN